MKANGESRCCYPLCSPHAAKFTVTALTCREKTEMRLSEKIRSDARLHIPINTIQTTHGTDHKLEKGLKVQQKLQSKPYWVRLKPIAVKKLHA